MIQSCGQVDMNEQLDGNASYDPFMGTPPRPYDGQAFEYPGGGCNPHEYLFLISKLFGKFRGVRVDRVVAERWGLSGWRAGEWALEQQHGGHLLRRLLVRRHIYPSCNQQPDRLRVLFSLVGPQRVSLRNHQPCPFVMARNFRAGVPALHLINQSLMSIRLTAHNSVVGSGQVLCRGPERDGGAEQRERRPLRPHLLLLVRTKR